MQRLVKIYTPKNAPVKAHNLTCQYQASKEGVYATVDFEVAEWTDNVPDESLEVQDNLIVSGSKGVEAVEFTFVLYDIFDNFLTGIQGIAGPGKYPVSSKKHKAKWLFEIDGAFSQYHALCFPSQARSLNGRVWRCDRHECIEWLNLMLKDAAKGVTEEDVFAEDTAREGIRE